MHNAATNNRVFMGADIWYMPPAGAIASDQARKLFGKARILQYSINKNLVHVPMDGVDDTQLITTFPALGNIPVYQTAMSLTVPPSLGF